MRTKADIPEPDYAWMLDDGCWMMWNLKFTWLSITLLCQLILATGFGEPSSFFQSGEPFWFTCRPSS
jgi:hypothetical protein